MGIGNEGRGVSTLLSSGMIRFCNTPSFSFYGGYKSIYAYKVELHTNANLQGSSVPAPWTATLPEWHVVPVMVMAAPVRVIGCHGHVIAGGPLLFKGDDGVLVCL